MRHVYDLNAIYDANTITVDFYELAKTIITNDAKQFKNQHPEYSLDPVAEIKKSLALLNEKPIWKERYRDFIETMVYDKKTALAYTDAISTLEKITTSTLSRL